MASRARERTCRGLARLDTADHAIYAAIAATSAPALDGPVRRLSEAANYSRIWLAIAAVLAVFGGRGGRCAAVRGIGAVGVSSALVNLGAKAIWFRQRPDATGAGLPAARQVAMPASRSFPSGHSASAFAFAAGAGRGLPWLRPPLRVLAAAVACSRVYTGVHYPSDVLAGSVAGWCTGRAVPALIDRMAARPGCDGRRGRDA